MKKIDQYVNFVNLTSNVKANLIKNAKVIQDNGELQWQQKHFDQENFINLNVFDDIIKNTYKLHTYRHNSKGKPKAIVTYFHGLGQHIGLSANLAHYFAQRNITTVGYDYRGFGKSEGTRAYMENFETHIKDCQQFINIIKQIYPQIPIFCAGLSLGGLTTYHLTLKYPEIFKGALLIAPALRPSIDISNNLNTVVNVLKFISFLLPREIGLMKGDFDTFCRFRSRINRLKNDKLYIHQKVPLRTIKTLLETTQKIGETFTSYKTSFMIVMGGRDKLVDPQVAFDLFSKSVTKEQDKDILFYEEMWHNVLYEPQIIEIQEKMADWILARC